MAGLLVDDEVGFVEGAVLVTGLIVYIAFSIYEARLDKDILDVEFADSMHETKPSVIQSLGLLIVGLIMLKFGSGYFIDGAIAIARSFGIGEALIGLTLIALGTSLPELAATVVASIKNRGDIAIGNAIGSSIFNLLGILGVTAMVTPIERGGIAWTDIGIMTLLGIILMPMLFTKRLLSRMEGVVLLCCYAGYIAFLGSRI